MDLVRRDLAATIASLAAEQDRLLAEAAKFQAAADRLTVAITALRELEASPTATAAVKPTTAPPAPREPKPTAIAYTHCQYAPCGKPLLAPNAQGGRPRQFCNTGCGKKARRGVVVDVLRREDLIPESGSGMKARIAKMAASSGVLKSRFLEAAKARNEEAAKRSAAGR